MAERMPETLERGADAATSRDAAARAGNRLFSSAYQLRNERRPMSTDILKRKIRNFPAANLSERIAAAS
jgi:hypothetical protein